MNIIGAFVSIQLNQKDNAGKVSIGIAFGNINASFNRVNEADFALIKDGSTYIYGNGSDDIDIKTTSGNVSIRKKLAFRTYVSTKHREKSVFFE